MNTPKTILAVLLAATAIGAGAQTTGVAQGQPATGATYRPTLDGQQTTTPAPTIDMRPMTQEEKATGRQEPSRLKDIDPATHPAPQNVRPQPVPMPRPQDSQAVPPSARVTPTPAPTAAPAPAGPTSSPVSACTGATCTDASGATTAGQVGNASVNSAGRLCNRTGNTMQCF
jgi:hypothetical protein